MFRAAFFEKSDEVECVVSRGPADEMYMVIFENRATPIETPKYKNPYRGDPRKASLNWGNPKPQFLNLNPKTLHIAQIPYKGFVKPIHGCTRVLGYLGFVAATRKAGDHLEPAPRRPSINHNPLDPRPSKPLFQRLYPKGPST